MQRLLLSLTIFIVQAAIAIECPPQMIKIPEGKFTIFFRENKDKQQIIDVKPFCMDEIPVTINDFHAFTMANPKFRKKQISSLYADQRYLENWNSELLSKKNLHKTGKLPVVFVSWFAARQFCLELGKRLPTLTEWEYASDSTDPKVIEQILEWYGKNSEETASPVGMSKSNKYHLKDMHGLIWEWVEDFNSILISPDSRAKGSKGEEVFCGGGSINAEDSKQYATFMRYAFRGALKGNYTTHTLGFRCAKDVEK